MLLHHPSFPDVTEEVPDESAADWIAAGWREDPPAPPAADATPTPVPASTPTTDTIGVGHLTGDDQAPTNPEPPAGTQE